MKSKHRFSAVVAIAAAGVLALSGCSAQGGKQDEDGVDTPELDIAFITHGGKGDTFWDIVRTGAEDAAAKSNVNLNYQSDPEAAGQATLIENAVDQKVDGIAVTLSKPEALEGAIKAATEAGIPVVGLNAGIDQWQDMGLLEYFGSDESLAGEAFGERLNETDAKKALCVIHEQGSVSLETRCSSLAEAFDGETEEVYVEGEDMTDVKSTLTSTLQSDSDVDYVATLGAPFALTAVEAVADAGGDAKVATFDTNSELVGAIKDGSVEWAVDQQPYLQGYLAVDGLWLYNANGNTSGGGTEPVLTGPAFVDESNVDDVAEYAEKGTR
ncbi:MAG: sugar ABC transporter substrate-binding protein [Stackebrandtia sp.]